MNIHTNKNYIYNDKTYKFIQTFTYIHILPISVMIISSGIIPESVYLVSFPTYICVNIYVIYV
jgi:hypothetical protein